MKKVISFLALGFFLVACSKVAKKEPSFVPQKFRLGDTLKIVGDSFYEGCVGIAANIDVVDLTKDVAEARYSLVNVRCPGSKGPFSIKALERALVKVPARPSND